MIKFKNIALFFIMTGTLACTEIFEQDITGQGVTLLSPADSAGLSTNEVLFWWEPLENATDYRLQVVQPDFDAPQKLLIDTLVKSNKVSVNLQGGNYEWRLRGENSAYQTVYQRRSFRIDTVSGLSALQIISPLQDHHTQNSQIVFEWEEVIGADYYVLEIVSPQFWDTTLVTTGFSRSFGQMNQEYAWRVSAHNASGKVSTVLHHFKVDTISPKMPDLLRPGNEELLSAFPLEFTWQSDAAEQISRDSLWLYQVLNDGQTMQYTLYGEYIQQQQTLSIDTLPDGQFQWMVRSVDKAGNSGELSGIRNFEVKTN